jgi:hypothetical protein
LIDDTIAAAIKATIAEVAVDELAGLSVCGIVSTFTRC